MAETCGNSVSFTSFESTSDILTTIVDDGVCPSHPGRPINVFCYTDKSFMCLNCAIQHKGHHIAAFETMDDAREIVKEVQSILYCTKHKEKTCQLYCEDDQRPVCDTCCLVGCKNHKIEEISDLYLKSRRILDDLQKEVSAIRESPKIQAFLGAPLSTVQRLRERKEVEIKRIEKEFEDLARKLNLKKEELVEEARRDFDENIETVQKDLSRFERLTEWEQFYHKLILENQYEAIKYCKSDELKVWQDDALKTTNLLKNSLESGEETINEIREELDFRVENCGLFLRFPSIESLVQHSFERVSLPLEKPTPSSLICYSEKVAHIMSLFDARRKSSVDLSRNTLLPVSTNTKTWALDEESVILYHGVTPGLQGLGISHQPMIQIFNTKQGKATTTRKVNFPYSLGFMNPPHTKLYLLNPDLYEYDVDSDKLQFLTKLPSENPINCFGCVFTIKYSDIIVSGQTKATLGNNNQAEIILSFYNIGSNVGKFKRKEWKTIRFPAINRSFVQPGFLIPVSLDKLLYLSAEVSFGGNLPLGGNPMGLGMGGNFGAMSYTPPESNSYILDIQTETITSSYLEFEGRGFKVPFSQFGSHAETEDSVYFITDQGFKVRIDKSTFATEIF
mmetsp:Transcript_15019/g.16675  ORF Transcript_15019/g.16675 Transcript_15019/m.16675 type:complete len:620 (+) Transcript_15019:60-1919(+)